MAYTTKKATKAAIKALPALRASIIWHKREAVRSLCRLAADASSASLRAAYEAKARKVRATDLADLRASYMAERIGEIKNAKRFELTRILPDIVWLAA